MEIPEADRRALRIVATALTTGPLLFLVVVLFLRTRPEADTPEDMPLTFACIVGAVAVVAVHAFFARKPARDPEALRALVIKRLAISEGAALFGCVAYLLEGRILAGGIALAIVGFMASQQFPNDERLAEWTQGSGGGGD